MNRSIMSGCIVALLVIFTAAGCGGNNGQGWCSEFEGDPLCTTVENNTNISTGDVCEQALQVFASAIDSACANYPSCCLCQCWQNGRQMPKEWAPCTCEPFQTTGSCEGQAYEQASACMEDTTACAQQLTSAVEQSCSQF